jgi:hypothetical protein
MFPRLDPMQTPQGGRTGLSHYWLRVFGRAGTEERERSFEDAESPRRRVDFCDMAGWKVAVYHFDNARSHDATGATTFRAS